MVYKPGQFIYIMHRTITLLSPRACSCQQSNAKVSPWRVSCGFSSLAMGYWPSMQSMKTVSRVKNFHWNIFTNNWKFAKFAKLKTCINLALYEKLSYLCVSSCTTPCVLLVYVYILSSSVAYKTQVIGGVVMRIPIKVGQHPWLTSVCTFRVLKVALIRIHS